MMQEVTRIRIARSRLKRDGTIAVLECKGGEYSNHAGLARGRDRASLIIRWRKLDPYIHDVHGLASIRDSYA
jgi:hypothetical protein